MEKLLENFGMKTAEVIKPIKRLTNIKAVNNRKSHMLEDRSVGQEELRVVNLHQYLDIGLEVVQAIVLNIEAVSEVLELEIVDLDQDQEAGPEVVRFVDLDRDLEVGREEVRFVDLDLEFGREEVRVVDLDQALDVDHGDKFLCFYHCFLTIFVMKNNTAWMKLSTIQINVIHFNILVSYQYIKMVTIKW